MEPLITCEQKSWGALVSLNRPKALNAINRALLEELMSTLKELNDTEGIGVVVITGAGEKSFAAGADVVAMQELSANEAREFSAYGQSVFSFIAKMKPLVIAAVNGYALGGGCELALACDLRIASSRAKLGVPEAALGVIPGFGGTQRLSRLVGIGKALELLATCEQLTAEEALRIQLVNHVVAPEELMPFCEAMAQKISANSKNAIYQSKQSVYEGYDLDLTSSLAYETSCFALTFADTDQREGMTAFLEKRKPVFQR